MTGEDTESDRYRQEHLPTRTAMEIARDRLAWAGDDLGPRMAWLMVGMLVEDKYEDEVLLRDERDELCARVCRDVLDDDRAEHHRGPLRT